MVCPICGGDRNKDMRAELRQLFIENHLTSEHCNPGGRELWFKGRGRLQLYDECTECDAKAIREFLSRPIEPPEG